MIKRYITEIKENGNIKVTDVKYQDSYYGRIVKKNIIANDGYSLAIIKKHGEY